MVRSLDINQQTDTEEMYDLVTGEVVSQRVRETTTTVHVQLDEHSTIDVAAHIERTQTEDPGGMYPPATVNVTKRRIRIRHRDSGG